MNSGDKDVSLIMQVKEQDYKQLLDLGKFAFQQSNTDAEWEAAALERMKAGNGLHLGAFVDEKLAAKLTILPFKIIIGGKQVPMGGIAGVATWPEYRRQGLVASLLRQALIEMREQKQLISCLAPFSFGFYRKFGWEMYMDRKKYQLRMDQLPRRTEVPGSVVRASGTNEQRENIESIYERYIQQFDGPLVRTEQRWTQLFTNWKQATTLVYLDESQAPCGYVIYQVQQRELKVFEMAYTSVEAWQALWTLLAQHDSMAEAVHVILPVNDRMPLLLNDPRIEQHLDPYFMARIVDVEPFIEQFTFTSASEAQAFHLAIRDESAPWNEGEYELTIMPEGKARLERIGSLADGNTINSTADTVASTASTGGVRIELGIGVVTSFLLGYTRAEDLRYRGLEETTIRELLRLEQRIPTRTNYLMDFF